ncbi:uncharacterized mitochondrial protein AtMg00310-like [Cannabis sativa]|uniref:uncharacterized mitochondrial protein AtMg00310-like n=1 Tax=Cannabis sativa TaxID=3483 RepID=UPI0029CA5387|nr:uncharacterized mitochondrial protein AtMg00310-like [Cannabis sativa]
MDSLIRKFWWTGGNDKDRYMALIKWDSLCCPKAMGGLGFRKMEHMNSALLAKLAWQVATDFDTPWVKCFKAKYCRRNSFWSVESKGYDSATWKGILHAREIIRNGSITLVGSGADVDIWEQPWIPWLNYEEFSCLMREVRVRSRLLSSVADISSPNGDWNRQRVLEIFGNDIGSRICEIQRLPILNSDMLIWKHSGDGEFSVKGALNVCSNINDHDAGIDSKLWKFI